MVEGIFICAYDIYFLDEAGNRINAKGVTVTIDSPADTDNFEVYSVSTDGTAAVPDYSVKKQQCDLYSIRKQLLCICGKDTNQCSNNSDTGDK